MAQSKLLVTSSYAINAFVTIPNDPFPDWISNFLRVVTGTNPFLSQYPVGSSLTAFRPELRRTPLIVVTTYSVPCHFVGGICHGFEINCSAPQDNTKRNSASQPPPPPSGSSDQETLFIIAICRSRHSKRQRSHISVLSFGLHTRLLSYGRFSSSIN